MPAFTPFPTSWLLAILVCSLATLGDGVMILVLFWFGRLVFHDGYWFAPARFGRYAVVVSVAIVLQVVVESVAVDYLGLWEYAAAHPRVPWLGTGLLAVTQALVVPPFVFWFVAKWLERVKRRSN